MSRKVVLLIDPGVQLEVMAEADNLNDCFQVIGDPAAEDVIFAFPKTGPTKLIVRRNRIVAMILQEDSGIVVPTPTLKMAPPGRA